MISDYPDAYSADKPMTAMDGHTQSLESALNGLERVQLQLDNILNRLRSPQPRASGAETGKVPHQPESIIPRLKLCDEKLSNICNELNNQVDELGNLI